MLKGINYVWNEWVLLFEYYLTFDGRDHDDNSPHLIELASQMGRSPGSLDLQLRTIKHYLSDGDAGMYHASHVMKEVVDQYRDDLAGLIREARRARAEMKA